MTEWKSEVRIENSLPVQGLKLHVGCGRRILEDYINIDITRTLLKDLDLFLSDSEVNYINQSFIECSSDDMPLPDECAAEILCEHTLEHQTPEEIYETLWEFARVLKPDGILTVSGPNFAHFAKTFDKYKNNYLDSIDVMYAILCNTRNVKRMSPHRSLLWAEFLVPLVRRSGFTILEVIENDELKIIASRDSDRVVRVLNVQGGEKDES